MRISLEAIETLDAIDRGGSFAAAAEELFRVPSAITYTVQKLEQDLGVALFDRSGHRAELTEAGRELLREGRQLLRAAGELESRVKRVSTGCESELRIAVSDLFPINRFYPLVEEFYRQGYGTRVQLLREVYGGAWDALVTGRADISFGTPGEGPSGGGYNTFLLGTMDFVFAVAPHHPLAQTAEPLQAEDILKYRAIAAADSSRNLPPRTSGILTGQGRIYRARHASQAGCPYSRAGRGLSTQDAGDAPRRGRASGHQRSCRTQALCAVLSGLAYSASGESAKLVH